MVLDKLREYGSVNKSRGRNHCEIYNEFILGHVEIEMPNYP